MPVFSVIIPLYNKESYIRRAVDSVLGQDFEDFELVIVNDGSTDSSANIVKQYTDSRIKVIQQENRGVSAARNTGIRNAKGEWIAFLDADDQWYPNHLEDINKLIESYPNLRWCCSGYEKRSEDTGKVLLSVDKTLFSAKNDFIDYFTSQAKFRVVHTSAVAVSKNFIIKVGLFNESLKRGEDIDMWFRIGLVEPVFGYTNYTTVIYWSVPNSILTAGGRPEASESYKLRLRWDDLRQKANPEIAHKAENFLCKDIQKVIRFALREKNFSIIQQIRYRFCNRLEFKYRVLLFLLKFLPLRLFHLFCVC